jgi:hypothetical protein
MPPTDGIVGLDGAAPVVIGPVASFTDAALRAVRNAAALVRDIVPGLPTLERGLAKLDMALDPIDALLGEGRR